MVNRESWSFYVSHFSAIRLSHYLDECGGDRAHAGRLYEWNVAVSAAIWESFAYLEVAFRNALNNRLQDIHDEKGRTGHWIFDEACELGRDPTDAHRHRYPFRDVWVAQRHVVGNGKALTVDQILSELPFGFWHQMVSKRQLFLWPDLARAFPGTSNRAQETVSEPVGRLRILRNRIGHHHRIWSSDIVARYADIQTVAGYLDADLREWIHIRSRVIGLLAERP